MKFRLLLVLFFFCGWASLHAEIKAIPERGYFDIVHDELSKASESIEITMFLIKLGEDSPQVKALLDDLIMARERGVKVKVILEDQQDNEEAYQYLKDKIDIQFDSPEIKTHAKKILIDNRRLIIGSSNWTESALGKNHESNVLLDVREEKDKISLLEGRAYLEDLLARLKNCEKSLDVIMYLFTFDPLKENEAGWEIMVELLKACDRGVKIRVIFDSWEEKPFSRNEKAYNLLDLAGIEVEYDLGTIATHNKLVIIDGERVLLGSANWTYDALEENVEASISIDSPEIAGYFSHYFDELLIEEGL